MFYFSSYFFLVLAVPETWAGGWDNGRINATVGGTYDNGRALRGSHSPSKIQMLATDFCTNTLISFSISNTLDTNIIKIEDTNTIAQ